MLKPKSIHALELGGTLFVPASHKKLEKILSGEKYPELRSVVIDFEDGLASTDRPQALDKLPTLLKNFKETKLLRFIRPQNKEMLQELLKLKTINNVDGFILPKFSLDNANDYLSLFPLSNLPFSYHIMPSIEDRELFDTINLQKLREILLPHTEQIICLRFGAQDMLRQLGLRQNKSIYMMLAPAQVIANIITTFKPYGFKISAPVFPNFSDADGFENEIAYELQNGLNSKTIIHPSQIAPLNTLYKVSKIEIQEAKSILRKEDGIVNLEGEMGEIKTQKPWAEETLKRANSFGIDEGKKHS